MNQQEKFLDLYCIKRLNSWESIANYDKNFQRNNYKEISDYLAEKCSSNEYKVTNIEIKAFFNDNNCKKKIEEINDLFNKYNNSNERKEGFGNFRNFYEWYLKQPQECHYCKTSQNDLTLLFNNYFRPKKEAWKNGTLQIEKLKPDEGYNPDNCVLACVLCNNAKSDLISDVDFKLIFAESMKKYLQGKINNLKK